MSLVRGAVVAHAPLHMVHLWSLCRTKMSNQNATAVPLGGRCMENVQHRHVRGFCTDSGRVMGRSDNRSANTMLPKCRVAVRGPTELWCRCAPDDGRGPQVPSVRAVLEAGVLAGTPRANGGAPLCTYPHPAPHPTRSGTYCKCRTSRACICPIPPARCVRHVPLRP